MDAIEALTNIDYSTLFVQVFIVLAGIKTVVSVFEWTVEKLGLETGGMRKRREEHELLITTSQALSALQARHESDIRQSDEHDKMIEESLAMFIKEIREALAATKDELKLRDDQINALMSAERESLADKINSKYKQYISMDGIPEDEYDEFINLHAAYKGTGGNHSGDQKFNYCMEHLDIIPVDGRKR